MISNQESKFIKSLQLKKFRILESKFVVEGAKSVLELLSAELKILSLYCTSDFKQKHGDTLKKSDVNVTEVKQKELEKAGSFKSNDAALAIVEIPKRKTLKLGNKSILAFDKIMDPGNLGTIIRIADWYGFDSIVCSTDSVDCYNAKVISATMGSFTRVKVYYQDLDQLIQESDYSYGAALGGNNLHEIKFKNPAVIVFGNESRGINPNLLGNINEKVEIVGYGEAESLNVAVSTAIFCDNFRRLVQ